MLLGLPQKMFSGYQGEVSCLDTLRGRKSVILKHSIRKQMHRSLTSKNNQQGLLSDRIVSVNMYMKTCWSVKLALNFKELRIFDRKPSPHFFL